MVEELKKMRQEALKRGEFIPLTNGDRIVALPLVLPGRRGYRVYLGNRELYYRKGKRFYPLGYLQDVGRMNLAPSPLRKKKGQKLPRSVENLFRFLRTGSPDLNPSIWEDALGYLERLRAAMGIGGDPKRTYQLLSEGGWKDSYPLPEYFWDGARLKEPWTSLRSLTGGAWDDKEGLKKLAEEALEKGEVWATPRSLKYDIKVRFWLVPEFGYETGISAEYRGLAHGHYGIVVNWRGSVFLAESD